MPVAALGMFPGIRFDPREPLPPNFRHLAAHVAHMPHHDDAGHGDFAPRVWGQQHRDQNPDDWDWDDMLRPEPHNRYRRPQPQPRPEPQREGFLTPLSTSVNVSIVHDSAKFKVVHLFNNQSEFIKQGVYQFPLPHEATVSDFSCRIGLDRVVRGKVKAKEEARREFDNAARQGRAGGLVEQQTAEVFTTTLANIPAHTKMRAELTFMCLLKHSAVGNREVFTLTIPTCIAPRYGDLPPGVRMDAHNNHYLGLEVDVLTTEELISVNSDTHNITYQRGAGQRPCQTWNDFVVRRDEDAANLKMATVQLEEGRTSLDKDLVITITTSIAADAAAPHACVEAHPTLDHHKAVMLTLPSDFMLSTRNSPHDGEIIFVADRSGSMSDKIESLKSAMMFFINGIPENRPFNIWCFGSTFTALWPRSKPFTEASKREAILYVRTEFAANMGGTDILPALENIYNARGGYHSMDIIVLTDGQIWSPEETINYVKERWTVSEGMIRFFSLGIGHYVSHELVEGIAKAGGGYAEVIASATDGGWEDRVVAILKAAIAGHIGPIQVELEWQRDDDELNNLPPAKHKMSPSDISTISPFLRNRVFWLFESDRPCAELEAIVLKARGPNGVNVSKRIQLKHLNLPDATIHKLAVRALLGDLERGESWLHRNQPFDADPSRLDRLVREEAIRLGCKWSLVSKWTSLYAVEEAIAEVDAELMNIDIEIPAADDAADDALLRPRGPANANAGRLLMAGGRIREDNTESDSSDSEMEDTIPLPDDDTDGDSDDDFENPGNNPSGGANGTGDQGGNSRGDSDQDHQDDFSDLQDNDPTPEGTPPSDSGHRSRTMTDLSTAAVAGDPPEVVPDTSNDAGAAHWDSTASWVDPNINVYSARGFVHNTDPSSIYQSTYDASKKTKGVFGLKKESKFLKKHKFADLPIASSSQSPYSQATSFNPYQAGTDPVVAGAAAASSSSPSGQYLRRPRGMGERGSASPIPLWSTGMPILTSSGGSGTESSANPSTQSGFATVRGYEYNPSSYAMPPSVSSTHSDMASPPMMPTIAQTSPQYYGSASPSQYSQYLPIDPVMSSLAQMPPSTGSVSSSMSPPMMPPPNVSMSPPMNPPMMPAQNTHSYQSYSQQSGFPSNTSYDSSFRYSAGPRSSDSSANINAPLPAIPDFGASNISQNDADFDWGNIATTYEASAPVFNPPSSTSMLRGVGGAAKTPEVLEAESFVRELLAFQMYDGRFVFGSPEILKSTVGPSFLTVLDSLKGWGVAKDVCRTIAIVALIEEQFTICQDLWSLMVRKAQSFIYKSAHKQLIESMTKVAQEKVRQMAYVVDDRKEALIAATSIVELQSAPIT